TIRRSIAHLLATPCRCQLVPNGPPSWWSMRRGLVFWSCSLLYGAYKSTVRYPLIALSGLIAV
ncbi:MAG: hypothetical protein V3S07_07710, partial [Micropepsaceae bacterium]